ncbi:MAG: hypothetical protein II308_02825 [Muribaculaceae bacterium]|nr:hypothetical protein [Muribaculaceae bacterium]MBQ2398986.1 hypothetical protein [Muribaculaceae bacterium]
MIYLIEEDLVYARSGIIEADSLKDAIKGSWDIDWEEGDPSRCFVSASIGLDADGNPAETEDDVVDWEEIERADS